MFCIEATAVEAIGRITPGCLGLYNDATEAALKPILASVRKHSKTAVVMQLAHAGRKALEPHAMGRRPADPACRRRLAGRRRPSAIPHKEGETPPLAFDAAGLARVRDAFVAAAKRAERLGIDAIEVHCAHGYLLHQFLSPISNQRTDQYGGSLAEPHALSARSVRRGARGVSGATSRSASRFPRPTGSRAAGTSRRPSNSPRN